MAFNFRDVAQSTVQGSPVMAGKDKITTDQVIRRFPNGITITAFDLVDGDRDAYAVVNFSEDPGVYLAGGKILTDICTRWCAGFASVEECSRALGECGGVRVKLSIGRTKSGNNITRVNVL